MAELLIATTNRGKFAELSRFLQENVDHLTTVSLRDLPTAMPEVEESGKTFLENALRKARAFSSASGLPTLSDDSGLEVEALEGRPGVHSARYAETDTQRVEKLLGEMREEADRTARFVCAAAVAFPDGGAVHSIGTLDGQIAKEPKGSNGFGYDPLFFVPTLGRTLAEMSTEEKNRISHRAEALRRLLPLLLPRLDPDR